MAKPSPLQVRNLVMAFLAIVVVVWNVFSDGPVMLTVIFGVCGVLALGSAAINGRE
ncbi:hypothetical protein [Saccharomonospora viridis]|jgi:hypothetical protein|uniref:Uncharacterized protein n=1 Tax=Saccharomonospora viridis TaxID=1852 RepID=A0A837DC88_9PSEU|nr:hypothetical protein [Saccharomonospora viridis]KHF43416.1 hypothetical protein MINT15_36180 [Saccharomonospora viridis]SFO79391.1 hypothetical protein SAMN02982918_0183 [Saccharomonospora viridis]